MIWTDSELRLRFETAVGQVPAAGALLYGNYAPLLAARMNVRSQAQHLHRRGMFENYLHHAKFIHACLLLESHRCLVEWVDWAYRSAVARGEDTEPLRQELEGWLDVVGQELGNRPAARPLIQLCELLVQAHSTFCSRASSGLLDPLANEDLPREARKFLCALLLGDEAKAMAAPVELGESLALLPQWWEGVVAPALRTVGKLWNEGCVSVAEEHVATALAQQLMRARFPAVRSSEEETVAVVVPGGELHTVGAEIVRDFLRLKGYRVFYTGAGTPLDGLLELLEHNNVSFLLISTTIPSALMDVIDLVQAVRQRMGERRPRILVGGQAYKLDAQLCRKVGADACIQKLGELSDYLVCEPVARLS